ncbi:HDOD domain-containing protein [Colwellia sp. MSW7]|uniref:HDOD domain-containing protein n=1 Tax=Colwellia maritima TaxID=2912588 RepID=A0ABS9X3S8_9GAMM|nr:HDOD domain-containing protein [Colwellia maritima]MCI2284900.1 HDOD domain-containing protein [Colwellia maritima]
MFDIDEQKIAKVVAGFHVPVRPEILSKIDNLMNEEDPNIEAVANLISSDVGLSATILKIINSPLYGMNRRISEIKQAVMMLGLNTINSLVTATLLKQSFTGKASISLERFWDDANDIANAMIFIGNKVKNNIPLEMLYTIGLFHNCGIPLLALKYTDYKEVLIEANTANEDFIAVEEKHYRTNHAVLGYYISSSWHLPKEICYLILRHHDNSYLTSSVDSEYKIAFATLKAAENIVERAKRFNYAPMWQESEGLLLDILGISSVDYADLEADFAEVF